MNAKDFYDEYYDIENEYRRKLTKLKQKFRKTLIAKYDLSGWRMMGITFDDLDNIVVYTSEPVDFKIIDDELKLELLKSSMKEYRGYKSNIEMTTYSYTFQRYENLK